ncbi:hypothetical protein [Pseudotabrizicola sp. 4114]|uniref:hypothetical protein n=1 Tax=Pseudotabrizicola sp. 4114 TaxID=2817731 RepID=UPI002854AAAE|nr:hypothetical protein [Pseudorhodobacter sp. 4114]
MIADPGILNARLRPMDAAAPGASGVAVCGQTRERGELKSEVRPLSGPTTAVWVCATNGITPLHNMNGNRLILELRACVTQAGADIGATPPGQIGAIETSLTLCNGRIIHEA